MVLGRAVDGVKRRLSAEKIEMPEAAPDNSTAAAAGFPSLRARNCSISPNRSSWKKGK